MKITRLETFVVKIPRVDAKSDAKQRDITRDYFVLDRALSVVYSRNIETLFVKITTDDGLVGWGEVLAPTCPEVAASIIKTALAPVLLGENPLCNQMLWDKMLSMFRVRGYTGGFLMDAMAGIDIALWDLKGKALNLPCYLLMGGQARNNVPIYISSIAGATIDERMDSIAALVSQGNRAIKLHAVGTSWRDALEMLRAIRKTYDAQALHVMHDAHWNYTLGEAMKFGREMDELDLDFFEAPLLPEDLNGHVKLAAHMNTPIAVGEAMRSLYTFHEWIHAGAVEVLQPDIGRCGITDMLRIATLAEAAALKVAPHLSLHQLIGYAASVHVSFALPNLQSFEYQPLSMQVATQYASCDFLPNKELIPLPTAPGLGVTMDEKLLKPYLTQHDTMSI